MALLAFAASDAVPMQAQENGDEQRWWLYDAPQWIAQQGGDGCHDVWFCHSYYFGELPDEAHIEIATAGWAEVFVNGRNIDNALLWPSSQKEASVAVMTDHDITRFMRRGVNSIAIDYAPRANRCGGCGQCRTEDFDRLLLSDSCISEPMDSLCCPRTATSMPAGQLALRFYGVYADSTEFSSRADSTWLCHDGSRVLTTDGGEMIDSRKAEHRAGRLSTAIADGWTAAIVTPKVPADTTIRLTAEASRAVAAD